MIKEKNTKKNTALKEIPNDYYIACFDDRSCKKSEDQVKDNGILDAHVWDKK